jgi:hypothetical protein
MQQWLDAPATNMGIIIVGIVGLYLSLLLTYVYVTLKERLDHLRRDLAAIVKSQDSIVAMAGVIVHQQNKQKIKTELDVHPV